MNGEIVLPPELKEFRAAAHDLHRSYSHLLTPTFDADDLASVISLAFIEARETFRQDKSNGKSFLNWLYLVTRQRVFFAYRNIAGPVTSHPTQDGNTAETTAKRKQAMFRQSLDETVPGTDVCRLDILADPDDTPVPERVEQLLNPSGTDEELWSILNAHVFPSERELLFESFGIAPYKMKDVKTMAREQGCARQWIYYKLGRIIKRLRKSPGLRSRLCEIGFFRRGGTGCLFSNGVRLVNHTTQTAEPPGNF